MVMKDEGWGRGKGYNQVIPLNSLEKIQKQTTKLLVSHVSLMNREAYQGLLTDERLKMS